jgi:hypothetical protein
MTGKSRCRALESFIDTNLSCVNASLANEGRQYIPIKQGQPDQQPRHGEFTSTLCTPSTSKPRDLARRGLEQPTDY